MSGGKELADDEIDAIWADAEDAARNAYGPLGAPTCRPNPHPEGSEEADLWGRAFGSAYARENGY